MRRAALLIAVLLSLLAAAPALAGEQIDRDEAIAAADRDSKVLETERERGALAASAALNDDDGRWEVAYFSAGEELVLVYVDPVSGEVTESWTGH